MQSINVKTYIIFKTKTFFENNDYSSVNNKYEEKSSNVAQ